MLTDGNEDKMDVPEPALQDVSYGPHERNVFDLWPAEVSGQRPLVLMFHGGGWLGGDKRAHVVSDWARPSFDRLRAAGIHVAAVNYRFLSPEHPLPAPLEDAARAVQFLRSRAEEWNIDRERVGALGGSAGGCSVFWLAFHDDMADPASDDPVLRESTRLTCAAPINAQSAIYPAQLREWVGPLAEEHAMIGRAFGLDNVQSSYEAGFERLYLKYSPYTHLDADVCPIFMRYLDGDMTFPGKTIGHAIHHPNFGIRTKQAMDAMGVECRLDIPGSDWIKDSPYGTCEDFLVAKLLDES